MEKEVAAALAILQKNAAEADKMLKDATAIEATLDAPSGPAEPIKPSFELYGEFLLDQGRTKEAAAQFEQSLARTPNRRLSVQGLRRATPKTSTNAGQ
jgi:predicted negative regulator of RcsB-dependent stress response